MTFDLDLWPTDLKINRDHLLTKDYLPTKFQASEAKRSSVISCTRLRATDIPTYIPTYRPTGAKQYALLFQRGHNKMLLSVTCATTSLGHKSYAKAITVKIYRKAFLNRIRFRPVYIIKRSWYRSWFCVMPRQYVMNAIWHSVHCTCIKYQQYKGATMGK